MVDPFHYDVATIETPRKWLALIERLPVFDLAETPGVLLPRTDAVLDELRDVNRQINEAIDYTRDDARGAWICTTAEREPPWRGDCEDIALSKWHSLIVERDRPVGAFSLAMANTPEGQHAVLLAHMEATWLVLDGPTAYDPSPAPFPLSLTTEALGSRWIWRSNPGGADWALMSQDGGALDGFADDWRDRLEGVPVSPRYPAQEPGQPPHPG